MEKTAEMQTPIRFAGKLDSDILKLRSQALNAFFAGTYIQVRFELMVDISESKYSPLVLLDDRKAFDGQFLGKQWYGVAYFTSVLHDESGNYVALGIQHAKEQPFYIRDLQFDNIGLKEELLGGVQMKMLTNTNATNTQMNGFLLSDGQYVLAMDGGYPTDDKHLHEEIAKISPDGYVDGWFISHAHIDHYGALMNLLKEDMLTIGTLYYRFPTDVERNDNQEEWELHKEFETVVQTRRKEGKIRNIVVPGKGGIYSYGKMTLKALNDAHFAGDNWLNDSTVVLKMETPGQSVLFLGDLGLRGDVYLTDPDFQKAISNCMIVQLAHHGQNGVSRAFYQECKAMKIALYCAPVWLWNNDNGGGVDSGSWNTLRVRTWLREMGVGVSYYLDGTDLTVS